MGVFPVTAQAFCVRVVTGGKRGDFTTDQVYAYNEVAGWLPVLFAYYKIDTFLLL